MGPLQLDLLELTQSAGEQFLQESKDSRSFSLGGRKKHNVCECVCVCMCVCIKKGSRYFIWHKTRKKIIDVLDFDTMSKTELLVSFSFKTPATFPISANSNSILSLLRPTFLLSSLSLLFRIQPLPTILTVSPSLSWIIPVVSTWSIHNCPASGYF